MQEFWWNRDDDDLVLAPCGHGELWQARDEIWRCAVCEPPQFAGEVVARAQRLEQLSLDEAA